MKKQDKWLTLEEARALATPHQETELEKLMKECKYKPTREMIRLYIAKNSPWLN